MIWRCRSISVSYADPAKRARRLRKARIRGRRWRLKHKRAHRQRCRAYYWANRDRMLAQHRRWRETCPETYKRGQQKNRESRLARCQAYYRNNRDRITEQQRAWREKKLVFDLSFRLRISLQKAWKERCKKAGVLYSEPFLDLLGCAWPEFARYLQRRFKRGMSWDNFGEWTIDHTFPICAFQLKTREERQMVCHYTNLRPLWFDENRRKNGSYSKVELRCYKTLWRTQFGRRSEQLKFADQSECPF